MCVCTWMGLCWCACMCAKAAWVILKDMVWFSRTTFLLSGCLSSFCPLSLSSLTGFRPDLVLMLHPLSCPLCPSSLPLSSLPLSVCFLSLCEILPYPILSLRSLSPGVAGEIRGYNFLQSAESGPQHSTPSPLALPPPHPPFSHESPPWPGAEEHQQRRNLPSFCLLHWLGHFHLLITGKEQTDTEEKRH